MRVFVVAVAGSVIAHAVALVWLGTTERAPQPIAIVSKPTVSPAPTPLPNDPPPMEVVFLPAEPATSGDISASVVASVHGANHAMSSTAKPGRPETAGAGTSKTAKPPHSDYMTMRDPNEKPSLEGVSGGFLTDFLGHSKTLPPPPDIPGERAGDRIADLRARLKRAGRYSPDELNAMREELVALNGEQEAEELKPAGGGTYQTEKETFRAKVNADGSVKITDKPENMDGQDKMMLRNGIDPYARNKMAYLDRTRDQRVAIGKEHHTEELKKSVRYMQQHISRLWAMTKDVQKRKEGLFELWDECIEEGEGEMEDVVGGASARSFVMGYIRSIGFTPEEVRAFNARRQSKQAFAP